MMSYSLAVTESSRNIFLENPLFNKFLKLLRLLYSEIICQYLTNNTKSQRLLNLLHLLKKNTKDALLLAQISCLAVVHSQI